MPYWHEHAKNFRNHLPLILHFVAMAVQVEEHHGLPLLVATAAVPNGFRFAGETVNCFCSKDLLLNVSNLQVTAITAALVVKLLAVQLLTFVPIFASQIHFKLDDDTNH